MQQHTFATDSPLVAEVQDTIGRYARYALAKAPADLTPHDFMQALSLAARDRLIDGLLATEARYRKANAKRLYYLSMEFLMGRSLANNLQSLGVHDECTLAMSGLGKELGEVLEQEPDAALGNGGLGRLAACFLDSLATLGMPGHGYGINYEFGLFKQEIHDGEQIEKPDHWRAKGTPWLIQQHDQSVLVPLYGKIEHARDRQGSYNPMWLDWKVVVGVPGDMPIVGYGGATVNYLRLYSARSSHDFDMQIFNEGDYFKAVEQKLASETISKVLYPSDTFAEGRELRLVQEYFLVACALRDIMRRFYAEQKDLKCFPDKVAIQLNDTHPSLAVAELMRLLIDEADQSWEDAWEITNKTLAYTNHTLLAEALEKWPVDLLEKVLPRHLQIIYEINRRFLEVVEARWPGESNRKQRLSLIEEGSPKQVRMGHLAVVGSHSVNGVAKLHSHLLKEQLFPDFCELWPTKFNNKTNGVTPRRWLINANPGLASLLSQTVGSRWTLDLRALADLEKRACDAGFQEAFATVKQANKLRIVSYVKQTLGISLDPQSLFDVQIKRIHEYKRQILNAMQIMHQYLQITEEGKTLLCPKTYLIAGKAAPGYWIAKQIIKLLCHVADVVNHDPRVKDQIKVVYLPDYRVTLAELVIPGANLSEQISTAGKEASGTGNMKLAMNGALTIGTMDGANIEIQEAVGPENIFIFGLLAEEIQKLKSEKRYNPREYYEKRESARWILDAVKNNLFCPHEPGSFNWLLQKLLDQGDEYFHLADLDSYLAAQQRVSEAFVKPFEWNRMAILNVARMGKFSSDRTIQEYARDIWNLQSILY